MILNKEKLDQVLTELGKQFIADYKPELKYSHKSDYTRVRAVISYWLRHTYLFTFQAIANLFGVHYATIMSQCKRIEYDLSIRYRETKAMLKALPCIIEQLEELPSILSNIDITSTISIKSDITLSCVSYYNKEEYSENMKQLLEKVGFIVELDEENNIVLLMERGHDLSKLVVPVDSVLMVLTLPIPTMTQFFYVLDYNEFQLLLPQQ
jgi:hypothetical protein